MHAPCFQNSFLRICAFTILNFEIFVFWWNPSSECIKNHMFNVVFVFLWCFRSFLMILGKFKNFHFWELLPSFWCSSSNIYRFGFLWYRWNSFLREENEVFLALTYLHFFKFRSKDFWKSNWFDLVSTFASNGPNSIFAITMEKQRRVLRTI